MSQTHHKVPENIGESHGTKSVACWKHERAEICV